jgi:hypothetical protein
MQFQFNVTPMTPPSAPEAPGVPHAENAELLRQILEVQRQQLTLMQASAAAHDAASRWRAFLTRWRGDFPELGESCRLILPVLERTYGALINDLADHLRQNGNAALDNDFALQEFLDRYGMRLAQLGTILNLVAPLAESSSQGEST